jgi:hypothetical protein
MKEFVSNPGGQIKRVASLASKLSGSNVFVAYLHREKAPLKTIPGYIEVRWKSLKQMVQAFIQLEDWILKYASEVKDPACLAECIAVIAICKALLPLLSTYTATIKRFESDAQGTIGEVLARWFILRRAMMKMGEQPDWLQAATAGVAKMDLLLDVHKEHMYEICQLACILHPDMDERQCMTVDQISAASNQIREFLSRKPFMADPAVLKEGAQVKFLDQATRRATQDHAVTGRVRIAPSLQFEAYMSEKKKGFDKFTEPIKYWRERRDIWPELAEYALSILLRPCTSANTERHFSLCGRIASLHRMSLTEAHVEDIAMILGNWDIAEHFVTIDCKREYEALKERQANAAAGTAVVEDDGEATDELDEAEE